MPTNRRSFLKLLASGAASASFPASIARALEIPANNRTRSILDVEHIVVLMQENRSFDHYFGALRGVRGFGDPRAIKLPNGDPVWYQPGGPGYVLPFRPDVSNPGFAFIEDVAHDWNTTHGALNKGANDQWVRQKGSASMVYLDRRDIPFHYALADAFTICDGYHCSLLGPTDPNRYHMWTGWVGNDGSGGGPVIDNAEAGYDWHTYPERLTAAGISWKIYQDIGDGLNAANHWGWTGNAYVGNFGDNSLLYFHQYQNAAAGSSLYQSALTGTDIKVSGNLVDEFRDDVMANRLPQISYVVAPEAYTEHPNWPANYGAWYITQFLDALTANPEVWSKTALLLTWDENGGFFDHIVPPTPPETRGQGLSTVPIENELYAGNATNEAGPYGLGVRVPMLVISPWSKGGFACSEVFDHTSIIRFLEARFAQQNPSLIETSITPWRRAVVGDLTSAFNFLNPNDSIVPLPNTASYAPPSQNRYPNLVPTVPASQTLPAQEIGTRPARPLPYRLNVFCAPDFEQGTLTIHFNNAGKTAVFQVRSGNGSIGPWTYTVGSGEQVSDTWALTSHGLTGYDLSVYGPNGFLRSFKGSLIGAIKIDLDVRAAFHRDGGSIILYLSNQGPHTITVQMKNAYLGRVESIVLRTGDQVFRNQATEGSFGWYDIILETEQDATFRYEIAGHLESEMESRTDPAIAANI
jgi:phospholipase C